MADGVRRLSTPLAGVLALWALTACGSGEPPETPAACLAPPSAYLTALKAAPGPVRVGGTPISECLVEEQQPGQIATVGESVIAAATELNRRVRRDPDPAATVQLGYLVGAVQEAEATTGGIHQDLKLRLDSAARYSGPDGKPFSAEFERRYGEGYAAGQAQG
jgi:hypothetical protein